MILSTCKHCGEDIEAYFRGRETVWKHKKNRLRHCEGKDTKAEPEDVK